MVVPSAQGRELAYIPRLLEVRGVLEVGPKVGEDGRVSAIRLILDGHPCNPPPAGRPCKALSLPARQKSMPFVDSLSFHER